MSTVPHSDSASRSTHAARESIPVNYGPRCRAEHPDRIEQDIAERLAHPFSEHAYRAQLFAAAWHNAYGSLRRIAVPTLVVHGALDRVIRVTRPR